MICLQTTAPGVSVAQVALRYTVNANLIFKWLRDPKYRPKPGTGSEEAGLRILPVEIVVGDTVREADGLALSSRNSYLTPDQRAEAPVLYRALSAARTAFAAGERDADALRRLVRTVLGEGLAPATDYVSVADPRTLEELTTLTDGALVSLAVRVGATRLIDNVLLTA